MKLTIWCKIKKEGLIQLEPYNRARLLDYVGKSTSDEFKLVVERKARPKSAEALGYLFAGVYPAIIAHDKGLVHQGQIKNNPLILEELIRSRQITWKEVENKHRDAMVTFRPDIATDLRTGKTHQIGQELKEKNNAELCELITEIIDALEPQGYEFTDSSDFRRARGY